MITALSRCVRGTQLLPDASRSQGSSPSTQRSQLWRTVLTIAAMCSIVLAGLAPNAFAQDEEPQDSAPPEKKPLDHSVYDSWMRLGGGTLSRDGKFFHYSLRPGDGEGVAVISSIDGETEYRIERGAQVEFTYDSKFAVYRIQPDPDELRKAREERKPASEQPKSKLEILNLANGEKLTIERVSSFRLPEKGAGWVAYQMERPPGEEGEAAEGEGGAGGQAAGQQGGRGRGRFGAGRRGGRRGGGNLESASTDQQPGRRGRRGRGQQQQEPIRAPDPGEGRSEERRKQTGTEVILRNLETSAEFHFEDVTSYQFSENGKRLVYATSADEGEKDGVFMVVVGAAPTPLLTGRGRYQSVSMDESGERLAFLTDRDDYDADEPALNLYYWHAGQGEASLLTSKETKGLPEGWGLAGGGVSFSKSGKRLFFNTRPLPEPEKEEKPEEEAAKEEAGEAQAAERQQAEQEANDDDDEEEEPEVVVDIWHWKDPVLQPQQLIEARRSQNPSYQAMIFLDEDNRFLQLETEELDGVQIGNNRDADVAIANDDKPYEMVNSWETPGFSDVYLIDLATGEKTKILERLQSRTSFSPKAKYITWWDGTELAMYAMPTKANKDGERPISNLTELIPHPVVNELHDSPSLPRNYGTAGWVGDDELVLIYDKHDIWAAQPGGLMPPSCVTDGYGRENDLRFRYQNLDPDEETIDPGKTMLLSAFHLKTKASGYFTDQVRGTDEPKKIIMRDEALSIADKADDADVMLVTRSTFRSYPNLWVTKDNFAHMDQRTDANPQQSDYLWGTAEIHEWTSADGEELQGILYKPDNFDPNKKYPMMVYFYERNSDGLHRHVVPAPGSSSINYTFYVSRGYVVFVPDIPYKIGHPGLSCANAVLPGIASLVDAGFVDRDRIGVQGHSWGGYQIAYLVTRTDMFAAAEAGAPVSNMTSAYGGIRWSSGRSRMFQYERTQSRIGDTLWRSQQKYIENSPLFFADMVQTPLLILHNDEDGAVPWYQGIEMFVALRRLEKPVWMFNYNGEDHGLRQRHNQKDWTIRLQQYFDHFLQGAPAPVWLAEGVPGKDKGKTLGLELIEEEPETNDAGK